MSPTMVLRISSCSTLLQELARTYSRVWYRIQQKFFIVNRRYLYTISKFYLSYFYTPGLGCIMPIQIFQLVITLILAYKYSLVSMSYSRHSSPCTQPRLLQPTPQPETKKLQRQHQLQILQLQHQIAHLKDQLAYRQQVHDRQIDSLKAILQFEYTVKIKQFKDSIRKQFQGPLDENMGLRDRLKHIEQENRVIRQRFERSEKYAKQVEAMYKRTIAELEKNYEEEKVRALGELVGQIELLKSGKDTELKQCRQQAKEDKKKYELQISELKRKLQQLQYADSNNYEQLQQQLRQANAEKQTLKAAKDRVIVQQAARLEVLREASVSNQLNSRKISRDSKLLQRSVPSCKNAHQESMNKWQSSTEAQSVKTESEFKFDQEDSSKKFSATLQIRKPTTATYNTTLGARVGHNRLLDFTKKGFTVNNSPKFGNKY